MAIIRQHTATIAELAREGGMDPDKLLACVKETYPEAVMQSPITAGALDRAFSNFENKHGIKGDPELIKHEVTKMSNTNETDFYDEFATDAESKKQWENDAGVRQEFAAGGFESFQAFRRAEAAGLVKILGGQHE